MGAAKGGGGGGGGECTCDIERFAEGPGIGLVLNLRRYAGIHLIYFQDLESGVPQFRSNRALLPHTMLHTKLGNIFYSIPDRGGAHCLARGTSVSSASSSSSSLPDSALLSPLDDTPGVAFWTGRDRRCLTPTLRISVVTASITCRMDP